MILTDRMMGAAFKFRATDAWEYLADDNVFAVRSSLGETVYLVVMGNAGTHYALGVYIGDKGFTTYLKQLLLNDASRKKVLLSFLTFDCINCDFDQAAELEDEVKLIERLYAGSNGIKIKRKHGWPNFFRFSPYKVQWPITTESDATIVSEALEAATFMVEEVKKNGLYEMGFDPQGNYPKRTGGKQIPLLIQKAGGGYKIITTTTPEFVYDEHKSVAFENDILAHKVRKQPKYGELMCAVFDVFAPMVVKEGEPPAMLGVFLCEDTQTHEKNSLPVAGIHDNPGEFLAQLADMLTSSSYTPATIIVEDDFSYGLLANFCEKCGIKIKQRRLPKDFHEQQEFIIDAMMNF